jgi:hypothetical protein
MALAGVAAVAAAASAAPSTSCSVMDTNTRQSYTDLQTAVNAAAEGNELVVRGTCTSRTTIDKNLTITGRGPSPTLHGNQQGSALSISRTPTGENVSVTLDGLSIMNGANSLGGGISNLRGTVTLVNSTVTGNIGGGIYDDGGTVILDNGNVTRNTAPGSNSTGGGIYNAGGVSGCPECGTLILNRSSTVSDNESGGPGGGIFNDLGTVTMNGGGKIIGNAAGGHGGGVFNISGSRVAGAVAGRNVRNNTPDEIFPAT